MPELPEVETIKLGLQKKITGLKIKKVELLTPKSFIGDPKILRGKKVLKIDRRAKLLIINLSGHFILLFHLKMTGQLIWVKSDKKLIGGHPTSDMMGNLPNKHTRVIFEFNDPLRQQSEASGSKLYFNDQRRFGWIKAVDRLQATEDSLFKGLGPEPLEKGFSWKILKQNLLRHPKMPVKVALMDPKVVAGVGNIYSSEICFNARVDPRKKVGELTDGQFKKLHKGTIKALRDGIKYGGSTRAHFVDTDGRKGYFLDYAYVYGLDQKPCKICGTPIRKVQLGGRGTYYCPVCQS